MKSLNEDKSRTVPNRVPDQQEEFNKGTLKD